MKWMEIQLGDVVEFNKKSVKKNTEMETIKYIDISSVGTNILNGVTEMLLKEAPSRAKRIISDKDSIISTVRPGRRSFYYFKQVEENTVASTGFAVLSPKMGKIDSRFLFYLINLHSFTQHLVANEQGATYPAVTPDIISKYKFKIPPLETQQKIASILSAYDDLIENNLRRIKLLEEAARLIYKEWFVRLRFPGHEHIRVVDGVPDGWELKKIADVVKLNYGKALKKDDRIDGEYPVFGSGGIVGYHEKPLVKGPGIIVGRKGNVGSVFWAFKDFYPIDTVYYLSTDLNKLFVYFYFQFQSFVSSDCAVPGLNRNYVYNLPMLIPPKSLIDKFGKLVEPIYNQIEKLEMQNQKLREARDILLPRLMNGSIKV